MNIVFFEDVLTFGGARKSTIELASNLRRKGHGVLIVDIHGKCIPFVQYCQENEVDLNVIDPTGNAKLLTDEHYRLKIALNYAWFLQYTWRLNNKLIKSIEDFNADYVVVNNSSMLVYFLRKKPNAKIVLFARGWFLPQQISKKDKILYKCFVDRYLCVADATRYAIISSGLAQLNNSFVVHNYIKTPEPRNVFFWDDNRCPTILVSGGFLETKGLHIAIQIAEQLNLIGINYKMYITGIIYSSHKSRQYYEYIKNLIEEKNLQSVELIINKPNVIDYFKKSDILIHPSATEGLPRVVMEAMAYGLPVIANAVGGVTDFVINGYTGYTALYNNVEDYCYYIQKLIGSKELFKEIVDRAYNLIRCTYTKENQIESFEKSLGYE